MSGTTTPINTKRKPRTPTVAEQRQEMAAVGDVDGLLRLLADSEASMVNYSEISQLLYQAIQVRAADPACFAEEMFQRLIAFVTFLTLRGHDYALKILRRHDVDMQRRGVWRPSEELQELLPSLLDLQDHLAGLAQSHAATKRLWTLCRAKELQNEIARKAAAKPRRAKRSKRARHTPVVPVNRLAGFFGDDRSEEP